MKPSRLWAVSTREAQACTIHDRTNRDSATRKHTEEERKGEKRREKDRERKRKKERCKVRKRGGGGGRNKVEREERKGGGHEESERNDNFIKANKQRKKWATEKVNRMKTRDLLYLSYTFLSFYI